MYMDYLMKLWTNMELARTEIMKYLGKEIYPIQ